RTGCGVIGHGGVVRRGAGAVPRHEHRRAVGAYTEGGGHVEAVPHPVVARRPQLRPWDGWPVGIRPMPEGCLAWRAASAADDAERSKRLDTNRTTSTARVRELPIRSFFERRTPRGRHGEL